MNTKILRLAHLNEVGESDVLEACEILRSGGLVAFPTETVYGLGADAFNIRAIGRIFEVKGRPSDNPLIVHVGDIEQIFEVSRPSGKYMDIVERITPGPITFVFEKRESLPELVTAGLRTVGVRFPAHPVAQALAKCAGPIAAPSANLSGKPSPTDFQSVLEDLFGKVECIVDGGESPFGIESTIVDLTVEPPVVLRPGPVTVDELREIFGDVRIANPDALDRPLAPGMKYRHYSPEKPLFLAEPFELAKYADGNVLILCTEESREQFIPNARNVLIIGKLREPYSIARNLYRSFRQLDRLPYARGVVEKLPEYGIFFSIMNRIKKAVRSGGTGGR